MCRRPPSFGRNRPLLPLDPAASAASGVGQRTVTAVARSCPPLFFRFIRAKSGPLWLALGVGHNPDAITPVRGIDGASRYNKRPDGVACAFQVRKHSVEAQSSEPVNILTKHPSGPDSKNDAQHLRPEMAVIRLALALPGVGKGLAWESPADEVNGSNA